MQIVKLFLTKVLHSSDAAFSLAMANNNSQTECNKK